MKPLSITAITLAILVIGLALPAVAADTHQLPLPIRMAGHEPPAPDRLVDAGDYYLTADRQQVHLRRSTVEVAVKYGKAVPQEQVVGALTGIAGVPALQPVGAAEFAGKGRVHVLRSADGTTAVEAKTLAGDPDVVFAFPVLIGQEPTLRLIPTDEVLARLAEGVSPSKISGPLADAGLKVVHSSGPKSLNVYLLRLKNPKSNDPLVASRKLAGAKGVLWAEPNFIQELGFQQMTPNDPLFPDQQNMANTGQNGGVPGADAKAPMGWQQTQPAQYARIAIIDTGVDILHSDLSIYTNLTEWVHGVDGIDNDGNGYVDDFHGWDFVNADNSPTPGGDNAHGTACAGVAAARMNTICIAGMAAGAAVVPIQICDDTDNFVTNENIGNAITYAASMADVISCSWCMGGSSAFIETALTWANTNGRGGKGCPVFFAAGNYASKWGYGGGRWRLSVGDQLPAGNYTFGFRYKKDASLSVGEDLVKIDDVVLLDADGYTHLNTALGTNGRQDFEGGVYPAGWTVAHSDGAPDWGSVTSGVLTGTGGSWSIRSGMITDNQWCELKTPQVPVAAGNILAFQFYLSSEADIPGVKDGDGLEMRAYSGGTTWTWDLISGDDTVNTAVHYPASLSSTYTNVCAVGASTDCDLRSDYSCYGAQLDFVAPSNGGWNDIATLDPIGAVGWENGDFMLKFGGTSSATPLAAGLATAILGVRSDLLPGQVRQCLRNTCDKIGTDDYTNGRNDFYGYGRVNAARACDRIPPVSADDCVETHGVPIGSWQRTRNDLAFTWSGASDGNSGLDGYFVYWGTDQYGTSTNFVTAAAYDPGPVSAGTYRLRVQTRDKALNTSVWDTLFVFGYDNIAPTNPTTCTASEGQSDVWQNVTASPTFYFSGASDAHSGVAGYYMYFGSSSSGEPTDYITDTSYCPAAVPGSGTYYLRVRTEDVAGNVSGRKTLYIFKYDGTAPTGPTSCTEAGGAQSDAWQSDVSEPSFTWSGASDAHSGVSGYRIYWGQSESGVPSEFTASASYDPAAVSSGTTYYLRIETLDTAGSTSACQSLFIFKYSNSIPTNPTACAEAGGSQSDVWQNTVSDPNFTWSGASEPNSGIAGYYYCWGDMYGMWEWTTSAGYDPPAVTEGIYYLRVWTVSNAGNASEPITLFVFKYDSSPPMNPDYVHESHGVRSGFWQKDIADPAFTWSGASDFIEGLGEASGVAGYYYYWGTSSDGQSANYTTNQAYDPPAVPGSGTYYLRVATKDNLGNTNGWSTLFTFMYDITPPVNANSCTEAGGAQNGVWQHTVNTPFFNISGAYDAHSGFLSHVMYFGTNPTADPTDRNAANMYAPGTVGEGTYYFRIKAEDNEYNVSLPTTLFTFLYDATPPADFTPTANPSTWTSASPITISYATTDALSGVGHYEVAVDGGAYASHASPYALDVTGLMDGMHTVHVKAFDAAGNVRGPKDVAIYIDRLSPELPGVVDDGAYTTNADYIHAAWTSMDGASGVAEYEFAVSTTKTTGGIIPGGGWQSAGAATEGTRTGLSLTLGQVYYVLVRAKDAVGNWSAIGVSDAIVPVEHGGMDVSESKRFGDGITVGLDSRVVTSAVAGSFYIEAPDRSAGVRVVPVDMPLGLVPGDTVDVGGTMSTSANGERTIGTAATTRRGTGSLGPLLLGLRDVGGGDWFYSPSTGAGQAGLKEYRSVFNGESWVTAFVDLLHLNNVGLWISATGRVTYLDSGSFYLDDGSKLDDGSGHFGVKVTAEGLSVPAFDSYVKVTGVSSCYKHDGNLFRLIRATQIAGASP